MSFYRPSSIRLVRQNWSWTNLQTLFTDFDCSNYQNLAFANIH